MVNFTLMWACIVTNFFLIKPIEALIPQIYLCQETLHDSGSSSAHHQEFFSVHSALEYVVKTAWHTPVPNVQWKTTDDGQRNCPKYVDFLDKNKFWKLVSLLVLLKRNWPWWLVRLIERWRSADMEQWLLILYSFVQLWFLSMIHCPWTSRFYRLTLCQHWSIMFLFFLFCWAPGR
jgi:hypothetical protein